MGRNNTYKTNAYKDFESSGFLKDGKHYFTPAAGGNDRVDSTTTMTMSMLSHPAFKDLKPRQRLLYMYAKSQYRGMVDRTQFEKDYPEYKGKPEYIYLNYKLMIEVFEVYGKNNRAEMYKDLKVLVEHGFIVPVKRENNQRTIYKFIAEWQNWAPHRKYVEQEKQYKYDWVEY